MMKIQLKLNIRYILSWINCVMTSLNIITRGWTLFWIIDIIYFVIIAICAMVCYV